MDIPDYISDDHKALFTPVIHACELPQGRFKKKYNSQRIKNLNISEICDAFDIYMEKIIKINRDRCFGHKLVVGLDKILYIRLEYSNNQLQGIVERFTRRGPMRARTVSRSKSNDKSKGRKVKVKEDDDDLSVIFLSQDAGLTLIDIENDFKVDENTEDKHLITEIEEPNVDEEVSTESYFGPASKEEIRFNWNEPVEGLNINKNKRQDYGKYGSFFRAEGQVLEEIKTPGTTPLKNNRIDDGAAALPDIVINDEGNFTDFTHHMGEALAEVQTTPKRKPVGRRDALGTPSKRIRIDDGTTNGATVLPDIVINDEGNFANFPQHMEEALAEVQTTPKRKPVDDMDITGTPTKRSRRSLNEQYGEVKTESLDDDCWALPELEETDKKVKKPKKKKNKKVFDEQKVIHLNIDNIRTATVPVEAIIINPRNILTPAEKLFQMPASIFAGSKRSRPLSRMLLGRFQEVVFYRPSPIVQDDSRNNFDLQSLPSIAKTASQLRVPPSNNHPMLSSVKDEPAEELPPIEDPRLDPKETAEPCAFDTKVEVDTFPIEDQNAEEHPTDRALNETYIVDPPLPPPASFGQYQDTVPIEEIERIPIDIGNGGDPPDPDDPDDPNDPNDPDWDINYVYQRIKQLCDGGVRITFGDLAPRPATKMMNRLLAFEYILNLGTEEKIYMEQNLDTEVITIWLPEE